MGYAKASSSNNGENHVGYYPDEDINETKILNKHNGYPSRLCENWPNCNHNNNNHHNNNNNNHNNNNHNNNNHNNNNHNNNNVPVCTFCISFKGLFKCTLKFKFGSFSANN